MSSPQIEKVIVLFYDDEFAGVFESLKKAEQETAFIFDTPVAFNGQRYWFSKDNIYVKAVEYDFNTDYSEDF